MSSEADRRNPSRIHVFEWGFAPPTSPYAHGDVVKQVTWTHHYVLRASSPWMGSSIGVGLGAWETASAQCAPQSRALAPPLIMLMCHPAIDPHCFTVLCNTGQRPRRRASSGMRSHGPAVLDPSGNRAGFEDKARVRLPLDALRPSSVLKMRPDILPHPAFHYLQPLSQNDPNPRRLPWEKLFPHRLGKTTCQGSSVTRYPGEFRRARLNSLPGVPPSQNLPTP